MQEQSSCAPESERLIPLKDVPKLKWLPPRREGSKLSYACLWRWYLKGVNGVLLRITRVGSTPCTTESWLREFFDAVEVARREGSASTSRTPNRRQREVSAAKRRLATAGI